MNKDDSEPKPSDKFIVENSLLTQKTKPQKEKKLPKVASPTQAKSNHQFPKKQKKEKKQHHLY